MLMIFPEQIHRREKQLYHFIAAGNAFCPFFNLAVSQICSCSIDGIQKFVYTGVVFQLELNFYLPDSNHQAISRIPVTTEKLIGIMVQRIIFYFSRNRVVIFFAIIQPLLSTELLGFQRRQVRYAAEAEYALGRW